jgi:LmbE family N-acetylglucosaminyl deacetylase
MKTIVSVAVLILSFSIVTAQRSEPLNAADILLRIKKLKILGSVLYIAAHPDDENTRLLAWLSKEKLYRTGYLSLTRGDGGQNLIGDEQGFELGLIRTQELLAARKIDGAEQFFARAFDFGYSKTTAEALQIWNEEKILSDVVWVIRKFQPDVIITRFPEDNRAGHGHHSASSVLAHEAFTAAADPTRFPEQFAYGVRPWQAQRIFWNTYMFGGINTTGNDQLKLDVGGFNPLIGKSYGEIAAEGRSQHKSQGFGVPRSRGSVYEYFVLTAGKPVSADLMDGVDCSWNRVPMAEKTGAVIDEIIRQYDPSSPGKSVPSLVGLYRSIAAFPDGYWKTKKLQEVQELVEACTGLWLDATVQNGYAVKGEPLTVELSLMNRSSVPVEVDRLQVNGMDSSLNKKLEYDASLVVVSHTVISLNQPVSQPYWLVKPMSNGSFNVTDQTLIGDAESSPALEASFRMIIAGQAFTCRRAVRYKYTDAVKGEIYEPLTILPPVTASCEPDLLVFTADRSRELEVHAEKRLPAANLSNLRLTTVPDFNISKAPASAGTFAFTAKPLHPGQGILHTQVVLENGGQTDSLLQLRTIAYDHIPRIDYFKPAGAAFVQADLRTAGKRIGYIEGAGDKVPSALSQMGYEVVLLKEKDINPASLGGFDAVMGGVRAYDVHPWLLDKYDILMNYVHEGGNLIVQYERNNIGSSGLKIGPYPFSISSARITDESAAVTFIQPAHRVLNYPNKITSRDFEGWVQERGIYFAGQTDSRYEKIFSMHDPNESGQEGSLIVAGFGKGVFVYTGLDFFRELPAGVPGAYRLLANIIALNQPLNQ